MSKISELTDGGSLLPTDFLIAVRSGGNVKVQADDITVDQIRLGDNEKIELGNNQDLQIYHDGSNSYIKDAGTGDLRIWADSPNIATASGNKIFYGNAGSAELYTSGGSLRLATTAAGIDVTGTVTASSTLTAQKLVSTNGVLELDDNGSHNGVINSPASLFINIDSDNGATGEDFVIGKDRTSTSGGTELFRVQEDGSVGIGTAGSVAFSDGSGLRIERAATATLRLQDTGAHGFEIRAAAGAAEFFSANSKPFTFSSGTSELMRINSDGKILIGDPASHTDDLLQIETPASGGGHGIQIRRNDTNTDQGVGRIQFGNNTATDLASISAKTDGASDNGALLFNTSISGGANTERLRIDSSGHAIIPAGVTLGTAAGVYAAANTLDDYEEGTWTPVLNASGTAPTVTYSFQKGRYTKVGNLVTILVDCRWSANSGGTGNTTITGLPFANGDAYAGAIVFEHSSAWSLASGRTTLAAEVNQNTGIVTFLQNGSGLSGVGYDITTLGTTGYAIFSITYRTA